MNKTEELITNIVKKEISNDTAFQIPPLSSEEIDALFQEARIQSVSIFAISAVSAVNAEVYKKYQPALLRSASSNATIAYEHAYIGKLLSNAGIPYCILKGCASAYYYPNTALRSLGDVDFLVKPQDKDHAIKILIDNGFTESEHADEHDFHVAFKHNMVSSELHYCIGSITEKDIDLNKFTDSIIDTARNYHSQFGDMMIPDAYHHAVIMLFHVYRHYVTGGVGLRHLVDWAVFAASSDFDEVADRLLSDSKGWGLYNFVIMLCQVSSIYLGIPWKKSFGKQNKSLSADFMEEILSSGNFGRKSKSSLSMLFVEESLEQNSNSLILNLFNSAKKITCKHWPKAEKNIFLRAVGIIYFPMLYFIRSLLGKRKKLHIFSDMKKAKSRSTLNNSLSGKND